MPLANLSLAYLFAGQPAEAERIARRAAALPRSTRQAEYLIGISLLNQKRNFNEALALLEQARDDIPAARLAIAQLHAARGDVATARDQLIAIRDTGPERLKGPAGKLLQNLPPPR